MNLRKYINEEISKILSENSNLPAGSEFDSNADFNKKEPVYTQASLNVDNSSYECVYYDGELAVLKDKNGDFYSIYYYYLTDELNDISKQLGFAEEDVTFWGYEDGMPDTSSKFYYNWEGNPDQEPKVLVAYAEENPEKLQLVDSAEKEDLIRHDSRLEKVLNESSVVLEAKMPNEPFVKVYFEYEFPSAENRLELINIIKDYFGEPLGKRQGDDYWSTYIPELELNDFLFDAQDFNPYTKKETIQANRFKPLTKELKDGDVIKFFDYTVSETDPPRAEGYLKPGFIQRNRSLMKWNGDSKEAWIDNSMIDKYYFYHGDVSDVKDHPGSRKVDSDYVKIFFDDDMLDAMNAEKEDELRKLITTHKGQLRYVFGKDRASGGQRYTLVPKELSDDFIQAAYDFGAYEAETERNIYLEDKALNEIRKIVRAVINNVIK